MAGLAKGKKAGGHPEPFPGKLVTPDRPALSNTSASMEDLIMPYGYPLESYPVETSDGFILRLYRVRAGVKNSTKIEPNKPAVLLHHGVTLASSCFVVLDPDSSMGFYLADAGFDVWMANARGNTYSRGNKYYRSTDQGYWHYSMDEMALLDLASQIDFVLNTTGQKRLGFIGHSQGCTLPLMLLSARPEYNNKLWLLNLLGAVTNARFIKAPYLSASARFRSGFFLMNVGVGEFAPTRITSQLISGCKTEPVTGWCSELINFLFYGPSTAVSPDDLPRVAATWASSVSVRNLNHWSQLYYHGDGLFMYDFGSDCSDSSNKSQAFSESCNQAKYGQKTPPQYDLRKITCKASIFQGEKDLMATVKDVNKLKTDWRAKLVFNKMYPRTSHMDFVWGRAPMFKPDIIDVMWAHASNKRRR